MINGQALGEVANLKYGLFRMSYNGCEVISVYNALEYLGIPRNITEVRDYMEQFVWLFGLFGCNFNCIGQALEHFGAGYEETDSSENADAFILSSWTGKPFLSTIHTVFCIRHENGIITVYNRYNNIPYCMNYKSQTDIFSRKKHLIIYKIFKKEVKK